MPAPANHSSKVMSVRSPPLPLFHQTLKTDFFRISSLSTIRKYFCRNSSLKTVPEYLKLNKGPLLTVTKSVISTDTVISHYKIKLKLHCLAVKIRSHFPVDDMVFLYLVIFCKYDLYPHILSKQFVVLSFVILCFRNGRP